MILTQTKRTPIVAGEKRGHLTLVALHGYTASGAKRIWKAKCDCGGETVINAGNFRKLPPERLRCPKCRSYYVKHGLDGTRLNRIWWNIQTRCTNPRTRAYRFYGAKGIRVEWPVFPSFYEWAMANGYQDELTIDRIDPDGNYCAENCRWISHSANSKRNRGKFKKGGKS